MTQRMPTAMLGALKYLVGGILDPGWLSPLTRGSQNPQFLLSYSLLMQMKKRSLRGDRQTSTCPLRACWFGFPKMQSVMALSNVAAPVSLLTDLGKKAPLNRWQLIFLSKEPACCGKLYAGASKTTFCSVPTFCFLTLCRLVGLGLLEVGSPKLQVFSHGLFWRLLLFGSSWTGACMLVSSLLGTGMLVSCCSSVLERLEG